MPQLTLCMIARDEEQMLPGCLESVEGVVDQIVVVDTGSRDGTIDVARRHGAEVYERPWDDDFAAPRNLALAHARGDYVLQLDADERLAPRAGDVLRREARAGKTHLGLLRLHNASRADALPEEVVSGHARQGNELWVPRLMRRTDYLRYEGIIHESVEDCLLARGLRFRLVEADIVHLGCLPELRTGRSKRERNLALLRKRCQLEPESITPLGFLAMELYESGRFSEAGLVAGQGWALLDQQPGYRSASMVAVVHAATSLRSGAVERVLAIAERFRAREGVHSDIEFLRGSALTILASRCSAVDPTRSRLLEQAVAAFRAVLAPRPAGQSSAIVGAGSWLTHIRLGYALLAARRHQEARASFETALANRPGDLEAKLGLAEAQLEAGDPGGCLAAVEPLLGSQPDGWLLAAAAAHALGAQRDARIFLQRAKERCREGYGSPLRQGRHDVLAGALASA